MNDFIHWSERLAIGIDEIDRQHARLIDAINELHREVERGAPRTVVIGLLGQLAFHTRIHFAVEESLMRIHAYPDGEAHRDEHRLLLERLERTIWEVESRAAAPDAELTHYLRGWLLQHIQRSDRAYAAHFRAAPPPVGRGPDGGAS